MSVMAFMGVNSHLKYEPRHEKTSKVSVRPAKTQISLGICPVWSESSLCGQWVHKDQAFFMQTAKTDQTGRMPRVIWVFAGRTATLLVLSCCGSYDLYNILCINKVIILIHSTLQSLYNATCYNTVLVITRPGLGSQMVNFPIVSLWNYPFITRFTYNTVQFYGSQM